MTRRLKIKASIGERTIRVTGREAETLLKLISAGNEGVTPLDAHRAGPAFRLAAYVHDLKALGFPIECVLEPHEGGRHGRYRLTAPVVVIERNDLTQQVAA